MALINNKFRKGFTLVEFQVASIIASIIIIAALSLYIFYWHAFSTSDAFLNIYGNSRIAMLRLSKDIRGASQILTTSTLGTPTYTTSSSCVVLQVPSITVSSGIITIIPSQYDNIIYNVVNNNLYEIVLPYTAGAAPSARKASNGAVAKYCSSVTFYYVNTANNTWTPLSNFISGGGSLANVTNLGISLPMNETILSFSGGGSGVQNISLSPNTIVRLRNK